MPGRGQLIEVAPALYIRGQTLTWPADQKRRIIETHHIAMVVNLWVKVDPDLSGLCRYVNWPIPGDRPADDIDDLVSLVSTTIGRRGRSVLVHCEAGVNRSAYVAALVVARTTGGSGQDAWDRVEAAHPGAKLRPELRRHLIAVRRQTADGGCARDLTLDNRYTRV